MTLDFSTSEMKAAWSEARMLLINAGGAGYMLASAAGDRFAGVRDPMSTLNWILVALGCFCLAMSALGGYKLLRIVASIHRHLAKSHIVVVGVLAFLFGSALASALTWLRVHGIQLATLIENPVPARVTFVLLLIAAGWLISTALVPLLLNRRSLR
jgi:hypothetical protein